MDFDRQRMRDELDRWEQRLMGDLLPRWEDFPALPLYMDQVIYLLNEYLSLLTSGSEEKQVTPAMINNYVKMKIIPPPVKKRYGRAHLAYLVILLALKPVLAINQLKVLMPSDLPEETVRERYEAFLGTAGRIKGDFCRSVRAAAEPALADEHTPVNDFLFQTALSACMFRSVTQMTIALAQESPEKPLKDGR